jgi:hypothetical protein
MELSFTPAPWDWKSLVEYQLKKLVHTNPTKLTNTYQHYFDQRIDWCIYLMQYALLSIIVAIESVMLAMHFGYCAMLA